MSHGVRIAIEVGQRFGRLTVVLPMDGKVLALCDCGEAKSYARFKLANGNRKSCGCLGDELRHDLGQRIRVGMKDGRMDRDGYVHRGKIAGEANRGQERGGLSAKGPNNKSAKRYAIRAPSGEVLAGMNLSHLVRENGHLFDPADTIWSVNKWGIPVACRAAHSLYKLFASEANRKKSWKGWTAVGRAQP